MSTDRHKGRRRIGVWVTEEEYQRLLDVAGDAGETSTGRPLSAVIREALNSYVGDYGERAIFDRRTLTSEVDVERRVMGARGRRVYDRADASTRALMDRYFRRST